MLTIAILSTLAAAALLIATVVAMHVDAGDDRRRRALAKQRSGHLRRRSI